MRRVFFVDSIMHRHKGQKLRKGLFVIVFLTDATDSGSSKFRIGELPTKTSFVQTQQLYHLLV